MAAQTLWRSKLCTAYNKQDIESWDKALKEQIRQLRMKAENKNCFDCGSADTTWASPKLGVFICVECADVHRAAGAHITCVKNFNTYLWGPDEVALLRRVGNKGGRKIYGVAMIKPYDSKNCKVQQCTEKYGGAKIQKSVAEEIAAAKAEAETDGIAQAPSIASPAPAPRSSQELSARVVCSVSGNVPLNIEHPRCCPTTQAAAIPVSPVKQFNAQAVTSVKSGHTRLQQDQPELDAFLAVCISAPAMEQPTKHPEPSLLDLFEGYENW